MNSTPRLFVIQTSTEEVSVTAMDFEDAVQTWVDGGGLPAEILAVEEHENHTDQTIHQILDKKDEKKISNKINDLQQIRG